MPTSPALAALDRDLRAIFGGRLQSLVAYEPAAAPDHQQSTLVIVHGLTADDLRACAGRLADWRDAGLATPVVLEMHEFPHALDAFPFEFGAILADHVLVSGANPFNGLRVEPSDLRRACEVQARSHQLHFREGCIETEGRSDALADLILESSTPLAALLKSVARLDPAFVASPALTRVANLARAGRVSSEEARELLPHYLSALDHLVQTIDRWSAT